MLALLALFGGVRRSSTADPGDLLPPLRLLAWPLLSPEGVVVLEVAIEIECTSSGTRAAGCCTNALKSRAKAVPFDSGDGR